MPSLSLADYCRVFPPVDAVSLNDTQCILVLSDPPDPALEQRRSALVLVDRSREEAFLLAEFPGASELLLWAVAVGTSPSDFHALVVSPGGHLWEMRPGGVVKPIYDAFGEEGPATFGYLNCCATQGEFVYVGGMSNQLYRFPLRGSLVERKDELLLDRDMVDADSAIYGLSDLGGRYLVGVGGGGLLFVMTAGALRRIESGTNAMLNAVSAVDSKRFVACGAGGMLLHGSVDDMCDTEESGFPGVYFSDVRTIHNHHFWIGGQRLYKSAKGKQWFELALVSGVPTVSRFARGGPSVWAISSFDLGLTIDGERWSWIPCKSVRMMVSG